MSNKGTLHDIGDGTLRKCVAEKPEACWYSGHIKQPQFAAQGGGDFFDGNKKKTVSPLMNKGYVVIAGQETLRRMYDNKGELMRGHQRRSWLKSLSDKLRRKWGPPERSKRARKKFREASGEELELA